MFKLIQLQEPTVLFGHDQAVEDPRDGLTLFGPLDEVSKPHGIRYAAIGTEEGIRYFQEWVKKIQGPISNSPPDIARPPFPGFEAVFGIPFLPEPSLRIEIEKQEINRAVHIDDRHQRVYKTVEIFSDRILQATREEDEHIDIWFVVIPDKVYELCRPQSYVQPTLRIKAKKRMSSKYGKRLRKEPSLFHEENVAAAPYQYEVNFHNQLKARLLSQKIPIQIIKESTVAHHKFTDKSGKP
ncbi:hypothetical protein GWN42_21940, partial [candidate division KSB1 bacterium]|nr:hypothetical protein [candidate division KSB1 bacterium]